MAQPPEKPDEPERSVAPYPVKAYIYKYADSNWKDNMSMMKKQAYITSKAGTMIPTPADSSHWTSLLYKNSNTIAYRIRDI